MKTTTNRRNEMQHAKTNGGRLLQRGDTYDIECARETHRLHIGSRILVGLVGEPTWTHSDCEYSDFGRMRHACDYRCECSWPEWTTGEMFDLAYRLADEVQTKRGKYNRHANPHVTGRTT